MGFSDIADSVKDPAALLQKNGLRKGKIGKMDVDLVISSEPVFAWDLTKRALEAGYEGTDLRIKKCVSLTMECLFTDKQYDIASIAKNLISGEGLAPATWRDKYQKVKEVLAPDEPMTVSDGLDTYKDLVCVEFNPHRSASTSGALFCTLRFEGVKIVKTTASDIDQGLIPTDPAAQTDAAETDKKKASKKDTGTKQAAPAADEGVKPEQETSWLTDLAKDTPFE